MNFMATSSPPPHPLAVRGQPGRCRLLQGLAEFLNNYPADAPVQVAGDYMALPLQESAVVAGVRAAQKIHAAHSNLPAPASAG